MIAIIRRKPGDTKTTQMIGFYGKDLVFPPDEDTFSVTVASAEELARLCQEGQFEKVPDPPPEAPPEAGPFGRRR